MESKVDFSKEKVIYKPKVAKEAIAYDFGLKFGLVQVINQKKRKRGTNETAERKRVSFVHDQKDVFYGLFDEPETDFEIAVDNTSEYDVCFGVNVVGSGEVKKFVIERGFTMNMKALESGGKQLRFVSQATEEGKTIVTKAAAKQKISEDQASRNCSRLTLEFQIIKTEEEIAYEKEEFARKHEEWLKVYNDPETVKKREELEKKRRKEWEENVWKPIADKLEKRYEQESDKSNITVVLLTVTGKMLEIEMNTSSTIKTLKELIMNTTGWTPDLQRLIFEGKKLEDTQTLSDYGIKNASLVHLALILRGGGGPPPKKYCKADVSVDEIGERGVVCFGSETDQEFGYYDKPFQISEKYIVKGFTVELRMKSQYSLK